MLKRYGNSKFKGKMLFLFFALMLVSVVAIVKEPSSDSQTNLSTPAVEIENSYSQGICCTPNDCFDTQNCFLYENEEFFVLPRFSVQADFLDYGRATFTIAMNTENGTVSCFLTGGGEVLYKFPKSDIYSAHLGSNVPERRDYEGVFFRDLDNDSIEDIIILTYGSYGNWPQDVNLVTVFLQKESMFLPQNDISKASLDELIKKTGHDGDIDYITLDDVYSYFMSISQSGGMSEVN